MREHKAWLGTAITAVAVSTACQPPAPAPPAVPPALVTDAAARALGPDGRFTVTAPPPGPARWPEPEITAGDAREVARGWARRYGAFYQFGIEHTRGRAVNGVALRPCRRGPAARVFYAASPYDPLPREAPPALRDEYAPRWIVPLCERTWRGERTVATLAVATTLDLGRWRVRLADTADRAASAAVLVHAVRPSLGDSAISPEWAALMATRAAGPRVTPARLATVPELVQAGLELPNFHGAPQCARWRLVLEAPVRVAYDPSVYTDAPRPGPARPPAAPFVTRELYFAAGDRCTDQPRRSGQQDALLVAAPGQPAADPVRFGVVRWPPPRGERVRYRDSVLARARRPVVFWPVRVLP